MKLLLCDTPRAQSNLWKQIIFFGKCCIKAAWFCGFVERRAGFILGYSLQNWPWPLHFNMKQNYICVFSICSPTVNSNKHKMAVTMFDLWCFFFLPLSCRDAPGQSFLWIWMLIIGTDRLYALCCRESLVPMWVLLPTVHIQTADPILKGSYFFFFLKHFIFLSWGPLIQYKSVLLVLVSCKKNIYNLVFHNHSPS